MSVTFDKVSEAEREAIGKNYSPSDYSKILSGDTFGIALSGGGIRSASYCLGALQCLAKANLLEKFHYLSSVSGGGFVAGSLYWFWTRRSKNGSKLYGTGPENFPYGVERSYLPEGIATKTPKVSAEQDISYLQRKNLEFLRANANYLLPNSQIGYGAGAFAIFRTVLLNIVVWIPIVACVELLLLRSSEFDVIGWISPPWCLAISAADECNKIKIGTETIELGTFAAILWASAVWVALATLASILLSQLSYFSWTDRSPRRAKLLSALAIPFGGVAIYSFLEATSNDTKTVSAFLVLGVLSLTTAFLLAIRATWPMTNDPTYYFRRRLESLFGRTMTLPLVLGVAGGIPFLKELEYSQSSYLGSIGLIIGIMSTIYGHYSTFKALAPSLLSRIMMNIGAALFLVGFVAVAFEIALQAHSNHSSLQFAFLPVASLSLLLALVVNTNQISLHRYYRDRIMEAFMPSAKSVEKLSVGESTTANLLKVTDVWNVAPRSSSDFYPFPIINTNAVLINDRDDKVRRRGGDSFAITPLYCGSSSTGWAKTIKYQNQQGPLLLASAIAASGAAANSNSGYTGSGPTRDKLISMVMMLLNIRLGLWVSSPNTNPLFSRPNHLVPGLAYGVLGLGYRSNSRFLELSDGGHFDNLGLYELVRRKVSLIVLIDGEADRTISYRGMISVVQRIQSDFHATVELLDLAGPGRLIPKEEMNWPADTKATKAPYFICRIHYAGGKIGTLIYMKASMQTDLDFLTKGYRGMNPEFPHQSTADQFFDEAQFEAYRDLGYASMEKVVNETTLATAFEDLEFLWKSYRESTVDQKVKT